MPLPLAEEPFRIFFPTGLLLGTVGVSLRVLYYSGVAIPYPNITHARLMIEGLMAVLYFWIPPNCGSRLTSTPAFSFSELATIFTLDLFAAGIHFSVARTAQVTFSSCFVSLPFCVRWRADSNNAKNSPPNFVLVALGFASGVVGAAFVAVTEGDTVFADISVRQRTTQRMLRPFTHSRVGPFLSGS